MKKICFFLILLVTLAGVSFAADTASSSPAAATPALASQPAADTVRFDNERSARHKAATPSVSWSSVCASPSAFPTGTVCLQQKPSLRKILQKIRCKNWPDRTRRISSSYRSCATGSGGSITHTAAGTMMTNFSQNAGMTCGYTLTMPKTRH